jgi:hypothetical protein
MGGRTRKRNKKIQAEPDKTLRAILESVSQLYSRHQGEIDKIREESEQKIININFAVIHDCSDVEPVVKTKITFVERHTDNLTARLGNPDQNEFTFDDGDPSPEQDDLPRDKPKRGRPRKAKETEVEVQVEAGSDPG